KKSACSSWRSWCRSWLWTQATRLPASSIAPNESWYVPPISLTAATSLSRSRSQLPNTKCVGTGLNSRTVSGDSMSPQWRTNSTRCSSNRRTASATASPRSWVSLTTPIRMSTHPGPAAVLGKLPRRPTRGGPRHHYLNKRDTSRVCRSKATSDEWRVTSVSVWLEARSLASKPGFWPAPPRRSPASKAEAGLQDTSSLPRPELDGVDELAAVDQPQDQVRVGLPGDVPLAGVDELVAAPRVGVPQGGHQRRRVARRRGVGQLGRRRGERLPLERHGGFHLRRRVDRPLIA